MKAKFSEQTLIAELVTDLTPVPFYQRPVYFLGIWFLLSSGYFYALLYGFMGHSLNGLFSMDLTSQISVALVLAIFLSASLLGLRSGFPGFKKTRLNSIPAGLLLLWGLVFLSRYFTAGANHATDYRFFSAQDFTCLPCLLAFSAIPAAFYIFALRKLAPTETRWVGFIALMAAGAGAAFCGEFYCLIESPAHRIFAHWGSVVLVAFIGRNLGPRLLRW